MEIAEWTKGTDFREVQLQELQTNVYNPTTRLSWDTETNRFATGVLIWHLIEGGAEQTCSSWLDQNFGARIDCHLYIAHVTDLPYLVGSSLGWGYCCPCRLTTSEIEEHSTSGPKASARSSTGGRLVVWEAILRKSVVCVDLLKNSWTWCLVKVVHQMYFLSTLCILICYIRFMIRVYWSHWMRILAVADLEMLQPWNRPTISGFGYDSLYPMYFDVKRFHQMRDYGNDLQVWNRLGCRCNMAIKGSEKHWTHWSSLSALNWRSIGVVTSLPLVQYRELVSHECQLLNWLNKLSTFAQGTAVKPNLPSSVAS